MTWPRSILTKATAIRAITPRIMINQLKLMTKRRRSSPSSPYTRAHKTKGTDRYAADQYKATDPSGESTEATIPTRPYSVANPKGLKKRNPWGRCRVILARITTIAKKPATRGEAALSPWRKTFQLAGWRTSRSSPRWSKLNQSNAQSPKGKSTGI